jgi:hypothetical protein
VVNLGIGFVIAIAGFIIAKLPHATLVIRVEPVEMTVYLARYSPVAAVKTITHPAAAVVESASSKSAAATAATAARHNELNACSHDYQSDHAGQNSPFNAHFRYSFQAKFLLLRQRRSGTQSVTFTQGEIKGDTV